METTVAYWGLHWEIEKNMETTIVYWKLSYGIMEKKMETTTWVIVWGLYGII